MGGMRCGGDGGSGAWEANARRADARPEVFYVHRHSTEIAPREGLQEESHGAAWLTEGG